MEYKLVPPEEPLLGTILYVSSGERFIHGSLGWHLLRTMDSFMLPSPDYYNWSQLLSTYGPLFSDETIEIKFTHGEYLKLMGAVEISGEPPVTYIKQYLKDCDVI